MGRKKIDCELLVFNSILETYPTPEVERNLSLEAFLVNDLGLTSVEVYYLGLVVERELQRMKVGAFSDAEIVSWRKVSDIVNTVANRLKNTER